MSKRAIVTNIVRQTQSSYWFLPTVLALVAVVASQLSLYVDHHRSSVFYIWPDAWETTQVDGARATLSVISQSVLGVVGVMFSVTIVAVSFASGNFGPRLIGNFMRDRGTQWSLGILISTFVFSLLILRSIHNADDADGASLDAFVPHMSLSLALVLMGFSIMSVIYYVHHIPETINVSNISAGLGKRLRLALEKHIDEFPAEAKRSHDQPKRDADHRLCLDSDGYVQTYDEERLLELAEENDLQIRILLGVGEFVNTSSVVLDVWTKNELRDETKEELCGCFVVGSTPTEDQNLLFLVQQLVEMIARALSPGVNDPYTAINCLNWLYAALSTASNHKNGLQDHFHERIWSFSLSFDDIFERGVVQSYPYIETDALTKEHLVLMLDRLSNELRREDDQKTVRSFLKDLD